MLLARSVAKLACISGWHLGRKAGNIWLHSNSVSVFDHGQLFKAMVLELIMRTLAWSKLLEAMVHSWLRLIGSLLSWLIAFSSTAWRWTGPCRSNGVGF